jgi:dipeptidase D
MATAVDGLEPALVWKHFAALARVPRCSKSEAAAAAFVIDRARSFGLPVKQDRAGNVLVGKPASRGREAAPGVCLQGHLDMVCEKNKDKVHNFAKDPISLVRRNGTLMADGTTLGADNGIAVATNLAIMEDRSLVHGPLEFLFTVDEETGLTGAHQLEPGFVQSRILLNLDSEEEGALYVGCSGGRDTTATWPAEVEEAASGSRALEVKVSGLRGGHSGLEIDKGRGNALKILNRVLIDLGTVGARLSRLDGGNKRNAIPREAQALVFVPAAKLEQAAALVADWHATAQNELKSVEPTLAVTAVETRARKGSVLKRKVQKQITQVIAALPHGVVKMSADIPGLVETSTNVAVVSTRGRTVTLATSQRSSVASEIREIAQTVALICEMGGAEVTQGAGYPGWQPNLDSPILKTALDTYEQLHGRRPEVKAVHAGLECGIIGEKYPGIDMVSLGPTLEGVHSPDEKIHIDTVPKFYDYLLAILANVR